jgi:hypothetical protein
MRSNTDFVLTASLLPSMTNFAMRRSFCFALVWPDTVAEHPNGFLDAEHRLAPVLQA